MFVRRCVESYLELTGSYYRETSPKLYLPLRARNLLIISSSNIFYMQMLYSSYIMDTLFIHFLLCFPWAKKKRYYVYSCKRGEAYGRLLSPVCAPPLLGMLRQRLLCCWQLFLSGPMQT